MLHKFSGKRLQTNKQTLLKELVPARGYDENGNRVDLTDLAFVDGNPENGVEKYYWKVLTDRRMYGNDGKYLEQKFVTLGNADPSIAKTFAKDNAGSSREYSKERSNRTIEEILQTTKNSDRAIAEYDSEYMELAKDPEKNEARLRELVDLAAKKAGFNEEVYHGTRAK